MSAPVRCTREATLSAPSTMSLPSTRPGVKSYWENTTARTAVPFTRFCTME